MITGGIFGPKLSGKTTLAKQISLEHWRRYSIRSFVLDINNETWGNHALVITKEQDFWPIVWKTQGGLVVVDESTETIARNDDLTPLFTRLRHNNHRLLVIGHNGTSLLPTMREQIDTLYLFRQGRKASKMWAETMTKEELLTAERLNQYEFLHATTYTPVKKYRLTLSRSQV